MTREEVRENIKNSNARCIIVSIPTGYGKTKIALDATYSKGPLFPKVLIVYPKVGLKKEWIQEYNKWDYDSQITGATFTTYASLHKHVSTEWDVVIFDEGHHITERVLELIESMSIKKSYILSATVPYGFVSTMRRIFVSVEVFRIKTQEAIISGVLPDPKIILWPLTLDTINKNQRIVKNPKGKRIVVTDFAHRGACRDKSVQYVIPCTEHQYNLDLDNWIDWYKRKAMGGNTAMKNIWLHKAGDRLKWLASIKTPYIIELLKVLRNKRTLTFCGSIEQTEEVGSNCIHSKNKKALDIKEHFNNKVINHITAVAMLDEGANLVDCQFGIFANLNSSDRLQVQRIGRILRHKDPYIIIPYYKNTREEEIVNDMIEGYNKEQIITINTLYDLKV